MSIEKKSEVFLVEVQGDGVVFVKIAKLLIDNGTVIRRAWHRTAIEPGVSVDAQMGEVNRHLAQLGEEPITDYQIVRDHAAVAHTPEKVAAFRAAALERSRRP